MLSRISAVRLCVVLSLSPCLTRAQEPVNVVVNGGFEDGVTGWQCDPLHERIVDRSLAHSGVACLMGQVDGPRQARIVKQSVAVTARHRYTFSAWVRATNQTKLVLWIVQPGSQKREIVTSWEDLPDRWRRVITPLNVRTDGQLDLQLIAPSSHGAPEGQLWIDDVVLLETPMPPLHEVSAGIGFNDEPSLVRGEDGSYYAAWLSFREGHDTLQAARLRVEGDRIETLDQWQLAGGDNVYLLGSRGVSNGDQPTFVYSAEIDGNWDIYAVRCTKDGPESPIRITSNVAVDVKPFAAYSGGSLWIAWESNRDGKRQIWATRLIDGKVDLPTAVSPANTSSYSPTLAIDGKGQVSVAWHAFVDGNCDVYLRQASPDRSWQAVRRLTKAPTIDRNAFVFTHGVETWLVYENAQVREYHVGTTNQRNLLVAKIDRDGLLEPQAAASPLASRCEAGAAAFDERGRLWLTHLRPRPPRSGWDVFLTGIAGDNWLKPFPLTAQKGMDRQPALLIDGDRAIVCFQSDNIPNSWNEVDRTLESFSRIYVSTLDLADYPDNAALRLQPLLENSEPFPAAEIRVARGEEQPTRSIQYAGQTLNLYFGDLHEHSEISVCNRLGDQSVDESYQHMRDLAKYDFACVTDHGYNVNPYFWNLLAKHARTNLDPGQFVSFLGEEWTSSIEEYSDEHPHGYYGHRNLILADAYFPKWWNARNGQTPAEVWEELRQTGANFVHIPHQLADTGNVPTDWHFHDEHAQPVAEIFQTRGSYEYQDAPRAADRATPQKGHFLQDAWAKGIVIGVIASPDHGGGYGKACVYAPELTREALLVAMRKRRCYGTTAAKIFLDVRVNGHLMGEKLAEGPGTAVTVEVDVRCPGEIERVELCRSNEFIARRDPEGQAARITFRDEQPLTGSSYYYVRVIQEDQEIAWSSPVWFGTP